VNRKEKAYLRKLGENIRSLRLAANHEQTAFAHIADISRTQLYMIETGKTNPRIVTLLRIAKALDTTIGYR